MPGAWRCWRAVGRSSSSSSPPAWAPRVLPVTLMLTTAGPFCAVICAKLGRAVPAGKAACATRGAGAGAEARAWCPLMSPTLAAPRAPAATSAAIRRRGVDATKLEVFMVVCLS